MPEEDLDLVAASLRADAGDVDAFFGVLIAKLADILPEQVETERGGFLGRGEVRAVAVTLGDRVFEAERDRKQMECRCRTVVRGIAVKSEALDVDAWIEKLSASIVAEARRSAQTRAALQGLLAP